MRGYSSLHLSPAIVAKRRRRRWMQGLRPFVPARGGTQDKPRPLVEEVHPEQPFAKGRRSMT
jgi:hypothetical protein